MQDIYNYIHETNRVSRVYYCYYCYVYYSSINSKRHNIGSDKFHPHQLVSLAPTVAATESPASRRV